MFQRLFRMLDYKNEKSERKDFSPGCSPSIRASNTSLLTVIQETALPKHWMYGNKSPKLSMNNFYYKVTAN